MTNTKKRDQLIDELKSKHENTLKSIQDDKCNQRAYVNLPITLLERTCFDLIADKYMHKDQTKIFRRFVRALIRRYPQVVDEAKRIIEES